MVKDETKELSLEEKAKLGFKEDFNQSDCHKKKAGEYYLCKEMDQGYRCSKAMSILGKYYCRREEK